jgi:hypothetical protein
VLVRLWNEEREKDKTFATGIQTATFDFDADKKVREAYQNKDKFNPFSTDETKKAYEDRCDTSYLSSVDISCCVEGRRLLF